MISNSGHDENGRYSGGTAGDQTGGEWAIINWYNRPWHYVLRHPNATVQAEIAKLARAAALNNKIGYDQNERYTYWQHLKASNYDPAQITVRCEADCSAGVAANVKAVGYRLGIQKLKDVSIYCYTGNIRAALKAAGFQVLNASKYLTSANYLLPGDILLCEGHHVATNLDKGIYATSSSSTSTSTPTTSTPTTSSTTSTFKRSDYSKVVVATSIAMKKTMIYDAQVHLKNFAVANLVADGEKGDETKKAIKKALQVALNKDGANLMVDGDIGNNTKAALKKRYVKLGDNNYLVTFVEIALLAKGYNPKGVECPGSFGNGLKIGLNAYQNAHKDELTVDGIAGYNTIMLLVS